MHCSRRLGGGGPWHFPSEGRDCLLNHDPGLLERVEELAGEISETIARLTTELLSTRFQYRGPLVTPEAVPERTESFFFFFSFCLFSMSSLKLLGYRMHVAHRHRGTIAHSAAVVALYRFSSESNHMYFFLFFSFFANIIFVICLVFEKQGTLVRRWLGGGRCADHVSLG